MAHKSSILKSSVVLATAVLLIITTLGFTKFNKQSSGSQAAKFAYFGKGISTTTTFTDALSPLFTPRTSNIPSSFLPDLKVDYMLITLGNWDHCISNTGLGVRVGFSNIGNADAGSFLVEVNEKTQAVSSLPKGESSSLWFVGYSNPSTAIVDSTNMVIEINENNNQLIQSLPIPTLPAVPFCHILYMPIINNN